jgi:hypothetical protein
MEYGEFYVSVSAAETAAAIETIIPPTFRGWPFAVIVSALAAADSENS